MTENELTEKEFRKRVNERNPEEPEVAKARACDAYVDRHDTIKEKHVGGAVQLAMVISGYSYSYLYDDVEDRYLWTTENVSIAPDRLSSDTIIQSDKVLDEIEPEAREVRKRIFGDPEPPFETHNEMIGWIKDVVEKAGDSYQGRGLREEIMDLANEYRETVGDVDIRFRENQIRYFVLPDCKILSIEGIPPGTRLDPVFSFQKKYAQETGFTEPALLLFLMTGIRPLLPRWKVEKVESDIEGLPTSFEVEIYADNVADQDMKRVHRKIKELKGIDKIQPFKKRDRILISVVDSLGGIPEEEVQEFWKQVLEQCKKKGVDSWSTINSAKMRWRRLKERLE